MKESWNSIEIIRDSLCFLFFFNFIFKEVFATPKYLCHREQRDALIMFKNEFKIIEHKNCRGFPKTNSWMNSSDCCTWDGITCDANFGYVIELNLSHSCLTGQLNPKSNLFRFQNLHLLDLSYNNFYGQISFSFGNFSKLTILDLSYNNFVGQIPFSFGNFSKLITLDLSNNSFNSQIPSSLGNLVHLKTLNLKLNDLTGEIPSEFGRLNELVELSFYVNKLSGKFPLTLLNLTKLSMLILANNQLTGTLPPNMSSLSNLVVFDIGYNAFTGILPSSSLFAIPNIYRIAATDNQLNGTLDFGNLSSTLELLLLGNNKLRGPIPRSIVKLVNLTWLDLSHLNTQSPFDFSIFSHLKSLRLLCLSHLNTTTTFELNEVFSCFKSLQLLDLSGNHVSADIKVSVSDLPFLSHLNLSRCGLTKFPEIIRTQYEMEYIDISYNEIKGRVPGWLWSPSLLSVDLSSNKFIGFDQSTSQSQVNTLMNFFGANNNFSGKIPSFICGFRYLVILDLSNNKFSGTIPSCLGNSNKITGSIPSCLGNSNNISASTLCWLENFNRTLEVLDLSKNRLSGGIPENLSKSLVSLDLGHNQFMGKLPKSLVHFSSLEVLNVESNKFNDTFPFWLSSLQELQVLVLRSNAFHGPIQKVRFSKLRIIDISGNKFNGALPSDCFGNWTAMFKRGINEDESNGGYMGTDSKSGYYSDSMVLMNKGVERELVRILKIFAVVDFSGNKFEGEIPSSIGLLKELHVLSLSNNAFSGRIPSTMAHLTELESLDVSQNKLSGEIPQELGKLSFLSYMDFSHNQLVGPIPESTQFQTQHCSSFGDNLGLFGPTLDRVCGDMQTKTPQRSEILEEKDEQEVISWIAAAIGCIPGILFGFTMGYILLSNKSKLFIKTFGRNRS